MKTIKKLGQGMLVAIGVLGLTGAVSAAPKTLSKCQTIDDPGSYIVTKNLTASGDCLVVAADNVTIDLGGYVLSGAGTGSGVQCIGVKGFAVRNGTVTGFEAGIYVECPGGIVDNVRAHTNAIVGVVGEGMVVKASVATANGLVGLWVSCPSNITGSTALDNVGANLVTEGTGCVLSHNLAP